MKLSPWLLLACAPVLLASCLPSKPKMSSTPQSSVQPYGQKVRFAKGQGLQFADFTLRFDGQTHVKVKNYPNGFDYENFTVTANGKAQKIIWSMGTGLIDPTDFSVAGQPYMLELKSSEILGKMEEDELIMWRAKDWQQKQAELHPTVR